MNKAMWDKLAAAGGIVGVVLFVVAGIVGGKLPETDDPASLADAMGWLKLTVQELRDPSSAVDATDRLVRWLVDRLEVEA